jgi:hypothetical protein
MIQSFSFVSFENIPKKFLLNSGHAVHFVVVTNSSVVVFLSSGEISQSGNSCKLWNKNQSRYVLCGIISTKFLMFSSIGFQLAIQSRTCLYALTTAAT